jgi:hypothetical protein
MRIKFAGAIGILLTLIVALLGVPNDASALSIIVSYKSIHCDVTLASGGSPATDDFVTCAVNIKEITGFCRNPAGNAEPAQGKPFTVQAFVQAASTGSWSKLQNGSAEQDIVISNQMIQQAFDIYNTQNGLTPVFLKTTTGLCKSGWTWFGYFVTKVDATLADSKVPSLQNADHVVTDTGTASYLALNQTPATVKIPKWNWTWDAKGENCSTDPSAICTGTWDGLTTDSVLVFPFIGEPFKYCSRFTTAALSPSATVADSGLRIYSYTGAPVNVTDGTYKVKNCYLWRDVNKDPAFDLSAFGIYDPDVAHIIPPQTGNPQQKVKGQLVSVSDNKLGGFVLRSVSTDPTVLNLYTGECHQHGKENSTDTNYSWNQQGPAKNLIDPATGLPIIRDAICQGGSQTMDGVYDDGILP